MKQFYLIISFLLIVSGCVAGEYNSLPVQIMRDDTNHKPYQFTTSTDVARVGESSQRFEIRHGDCGHYDCNHDRRRIEVTTRESIPETSVGQTQWYAYSLFLPSDFQDITPSNTHVGQAKLLSGSPLWMMNLREGKLIFEHNIALTDGPEWCPTINISQMRGRWTDIMIFANFGYENQDGSPMVQAWVNGTLMCSSNQPMVNPDIARNAKRPTITMRYGIYNSYVSRWLNNNKTRDVQTSGFVDSYASANVYGLHQSRSMTSTPFEIDWGVELPTQVVYYDEVRIGRTREDVDVRLRYPN